MFRHLLRATARFGVLIGVAATLAAAPVAAQDRSTQERLDRLERDLNMLQRQVYRGAPAPPMGGDPSAAVNAEIRIDRIESQMRDLNGRVEEFANQVERLHQRLEQINSDIDMRFSQGGGPGPVASAGPPPRLGPRGEPPSGGGPAGRSPFPDPVGGNLTFPGTSPSGLPRGAPVQPPSGGTLTPPGFPAAPAEFAGGATGPAPGAGMMLPNGSATEQYNYAFGLLKQADYPAAEAALHAFIEQHPKDAMAGNAQYWLGETYFARNKFIEAASIFAEGYKRYPKGPKAPDTLLKLAMSLGQANQKQNACVALAQLDRDFPHQSGAIKDRAAAEKKHLGC